MDFKLNINLGKDSYDIDIKRGLINDLSNYVSKIYNGNKIFILTDDNVNKYYGNLVKEKLSSFDVKILVMPHGEKTKSFDNLKVIFKEMTNFKMTRKDLLITLGGGVIGDLGGFVASTYMRGIDFIQIPTSLLAMVDSSVGGKVAVDLEEGKNLIGSFYQPKAVFIDPDFLNTLTDEYFIDGMAEVIKYGLIKDKELFNKLKNYENKDELMNNIEEVIYNCLKIKGEIVEKDVFDKGDRMLLNFGHTLGHAIEKLYNYETYSHGLAVAIGMYLITVISEKRGLTNSGISLQVKEILEKYNLPITFEKNISDLVDIIALDKKNMGKELNIILLKDIGESYIYKTTPDFFAEA